MDTTLRTKCTTKTTPGNAGDGTTSLGFTPDYQDGRNQDWATATPNLHLQFTVKDEIGERFELGKAYTFTVSETED